MSWTLLCLVTPQYPIHPSESNQSVHRFFLVNSKVRDIKRVHILLIIINRLDKTSDSLFSLPSTPHLPQVIPLEWWFMKQSLHSYKSKGKSSFFYFLLPFPPLQCTAITFFGSLSSHSLTLCVKYNNWLKKRHKYSTHVSQLNAILF